MGEALTVDRAQPARKGRWGPVRVSPQAPPIFLEEEMGEVGLGREESRVWTFHAIQAQKTRAAEGCTLKEGQAAVFWVGQAQILLCSQ